MKNVILVLTNSNDGKHTEIVISKLQELGQNTFRFDTDKLASGELVVDFFANQDNFDFKINYLDEEISLCDIKSIWYRRPNFLNVQIQDLVQKKYAEDEIANFLNGLWISTEQRVFWLSKLSSLERARRKVFQLQLARELGFKIPRTIITNNPKTAKDFWDSCKHRMIFKAIYREFLDYGDKAFNVPTTLLTKEHVSMFNLVKQMPCLFQEFIDKKYELRVTIVGQKIFPVKIDSQKNFQTVIDWRNPEFIDKLHYEIIDFPEALAKNCLTMLNKLDLSFGAFDFAINKTGEILFLEINPNGQWYWLEDLTSAPISDAIVDILVNPLMV